MTTIVYTTGYQGCRLEELEAFLVEHDADLFDIRFKPWSPNPIHTRTALQERFKGRYNHVVALGNRLYKTNSIELVDYASGVRQIRENPRPVVLLCACADAATCHRTFVGKALAEQGFTVTELRPATTGERPNDYPTDYPTKRPTEMPSDKPIQERLL
jgi:hypothetical protein